MAVMALFAITAPVHIVEAVTGGAVHGDILVAFVRMTAVAGRLAVFTLECEFGFVMIKSRCLEPRGFVVTIPAV